VRRGSTEEGLLNDSLEAGLDQWLPSQRLLGLSETSSSSEVVWEMP
jgi:hypothetical protein